MKNKDFLILIGLISLLFVILYILNGCTKIERHYNPLVGIELGTPSTGTAIKSVAVYQNTYTVDFKTTPGAKYSVQVIPFGSEEPVKKEGFTATDSITTKVYNLSGLKKQDYDLVFIDISGKEVKHPITIK